jgi:LacI family transcriptional regulator
MKQVSIRDVARKAGVSTATVSHVINNTRFVREETRALVLKSIEELHYYPNSTARSFKTKKHNLIAFIVPDISNAYFAALIEAIESVIAQDGYKLLIVNTQQEKDLELENLQALSNGIADGFILASTFSRYDQIEDLVPNNLPIILIDRTLSGAPYDSAVISSRRAMNAGIQYLIQKGHTKIGYLTAEPRISTTKERINAYREAMMQNDLPSESFVGTTLKMNHLTDRDLDFFLCQGCTALTLSNNVLAIETKILLDRRGIKSPQELELLGFRESNQIQYGLDSMNLINQPVDELGRQTGQRLLARLKHPEIPLKHIVLQASFCPRSILSSGKNQK